MKELLEFCTDAQRRAVEAVIEHGSNNKAAEALGVHRRTVDKLVGKAKVKAAAAGVAPGHWNNGVAPGYRMGKVTVQRNKDGDVERTWEREHPEMQSFMDAAAEIMEGLQSSIPRVSPTVPPKDFDTTLLNNVVIGDPHLDMLAYDRETGSNWDSIIAEEQHTRGVVNLLSRAISAHTGMLTILGDSLHRDSLKAMTPGSGNLVDVDGRMGRSLETAVRLFRSMIDTMLLTHKKVVVNFIRGNHSETLELCLRMMIGIAYEKEPRVEVLDNIPKHIPYVFGSNFLLTTHGDKLSDQKKADIAVGKFRDLHGAAKFTHVLCGHVHHGSQKEISGCLVETFQALPTPDAWHTESGYVTSDQSVSLLTYHEKGGIVSRLTEYPRIFMEKAA